MPQATTPSPSDGDTTTAVEDNWESRYKGLQKVLATRDTDLTTRQAELDTLQAAHEQATADLATYRQRDMDASEEDLARQQYDSLRERFEPEAPTPIGNNQARDWTTGSRERSAERAAPGSSGWPT